MRAKVSLLACAFVLVGAAPNPLVAAPKPAIHSSYAIVPFGEPGEGDYGADAATSSLARYMEAHGMKAVIVEPVDPVVAAGDASEICKRTGTGGLIVGTLRWSQARKGNLMKWIPMPGKDMLNRSGILDSWPTHADVKLRSVSCSSRVVKMTTGLAEHVHHGTNVTSAVIQVVDDAVEQAASALFEIGPLHQAKVEAAAR